MTTAGENQGFVSVTPLLKQLAVLDKALKATPKDIAAAVTLVFENRISPIQFSLLLWALHTTGMDHNPEVLASTASYMRSAAAQVDRHTLRSAVMSRGKPEGNYHGGLVRLLHVQYMFSTHTNEFTRLILWAPEATVTTPSTSPPPLPS